MQDALQIASTLLLTAAAIAGIIALAWVISENFPTPTPRSFGGESPRRRRMGLAHPTKPGHNALETTTPKS